ncbi:unnamed protein product [Prorocentrum cordatum]|uniref:Methylenetetrahydrofolate reductase (NAD(P)H) n=1 Tax=Prorocentrum cordatum TaxID=2364126 RepID=A0ABN9XLE1_9DINO|nr:unnamed protein product [Polarella glacialis]
MPRGAPSRRGRTAGGAARGRGRGLGRAAGLLAPAVCCPLAARQGPRAVACAPPAPTCRLELMGLKDAGAYRRAARDVARPGQALFSGFNIPNKKKDEPLLEWAAALLERVPGADVNVHYSLKHQRRGDGAVEAFEHFCGRAASIGVGGVLLVTGPRGPPCDAVRVLERLGGRHPAPGAVRLGVAFNACLPSQGQRQRERERLARKLGTGLVEEVWLNTGDDAELLSSGAEYARAAAAEARAGRPVRLFGSVLLPNEAQLRQFRERPWNGVHFSEHYL